MILIVEDEERVAKAVRRYLLSAGYASEWVPDGTAAINRLAREPVPDMVLLDHSLPGADGLTVLRSIRSNAMTTGVPVVMATATLKQCPDEAQLLLEKPFDVTDLLAVAQQYCG